MFFISITKFITYQQIIFHSEFAAEVNWIVTLINKQHGAHVL